MKDFAALSSVCRCVLCTTPGDAFEGELPPSCTRVVLRETYYGSYHGGDPREFHPDEECSTEEERQAHREACAAWDRGEQVETEAGAEPVVQTANARPPDASAFERQCLVYACEEDCSVVIETGGGDQRASSRMQVRACLHHARQIHRQLSSMLEGR